MEPKQKSSCIVALNSGHEMPLIRLGTSSGFPLPPQERLTSIFIEAIEVGYRHLDTAEAYGSEEPLGIAVEEAVKRGLVTSRKDLFITSKLWCNHAHPDLVLPALKKSLQRLRMEYVDLYLIHWPMRIKEDSDGYRFTRDDFLPFDIKGTWQAMEDCSRLGLCRSIGVSNFSSKKIAQLLQHATIPLAVNQVEMSVIWQQKKLMEFCNEKGIKVAAWSPLGANGTVYGSVAVLESPVLFEIASAKGKTVAQVALRWIYEQGAIVIVKSYNKERMKQNLDIFDWELSKEELQKIEQIPQHRVFSGENFVSPDGPYGSFAELWDEDS